MALKKDTMFAFRITKEFKQELEKYKTKINKERKKYEVELSLGEIVQQLLVEAMATREEEINRHD